MISFTQACMMLLAMTPYVIAECPNACSGHGTCSLHDQCTCCRNWQGADCSQRTCPFGHAHVDTPKGDLDGSTGDLTGPLNTVIVGSTVYPYGTSEQYPDAQDNEGHFYMECSNKGLCNREMGVCECFSGYEGSACQRTTCPNDCSGHGTCEYIKELAEDREDGDLSSGHDSHNGVIAPAAGTGDLSGVGSLKYELWDKMVTMGCKCDPGFAGPDCSLKLCRYGIDPLFVPSNYDFSATGVTEYDLDAPHFEQSYFEIVSDDESTMRGTFDLTIYDVYGEKYVLDGLSYAPFSSGDYTSCDDIMEYFPSSRLKDTTSGSYYHQMLHRGGLVSSAYVGGTTRSFCTVSATNVSTGGHFDAQNLTGIRYEFNYDRANPGYHKDLFIDNVVPSIATLNSSHYGYYGVIKQGEVAEYSDDTTTYDVTLPGYIYSATNGSTQVQLSRDAHFYLEPSSCEASDECVDYKTYMVQIWGTNYAVNATEENWLLVESSDLTDTLLADGRQAFDVSTKVYRAVTNITLGEPLVFPLSSVDYSSIEAGSPEKVTVKALLTTAYQYISECSNRGVCNRESGLCECFSGYSHDNCDTQTPVC